MRKNYIIYPKFQLRLISINLGIVLLTLATVAGQIYYSFNAVSGIGKEKGLPENHPFFRFINIQLSELFTMFAIVAVVALILTTLFSIWYSHKVVGPVYKLNLMLKQMAKEGRYIPVQFRKNDHFRDLPDNLDSAVKAILHNREEDKAS